VTIAQLPKETSADGAFVRQAYTIRDRITADGSSGFPAEPGRYHLYVSLACPWAQRSIIVRRLLGLEDVISMSVVDPIRDEQGWAFRAGPGHGTDPVNGFQFLSEAYLITDPNYTGRYTVPCIWDRASPAGSSPTTTPTSRSTWKPSSPRSSAPMRPTSTRLSCARRSTPSTRSSTRM
jgi:putative glutathione S-transferase